MQPAARGRRWWPGRPRHGSTSSAAGLRNPHLPFPGLSFELCAVVARAGVEPATHGLRVRCAAVAPPSLAAYYVSQAGFEPATSGLRVRCANQLRHWDVSCCPLRPSFVIVESNHGCRSGRVTAAWTSIVHITIGSAGESRTPNLLILSQVSLPVGLRRRACYVSCDRGARTHLPGMPAVESLSRLAGLDERCHPLTRASSYLWPRTNVAWAGLEPAVSCSQGRWLGR